MNRRDYKNFTEGEYYHIYNRGVAKENIFRDESDYASFVKRMRLVLGLKGGTPIIKSHDSSLVPRSIKIRALPRDCFEIVAFCLMPNHFHFLIKQNSKISITEFILKLCTSYSMYFNKKYDRVGPLFQDTFKAADVAENNYLLWLSAYIHQNPAVAGLVMDLKKWKWSSYGEYSYTEAGDGVCSKSIILDQFKDGREGYLKFLDSSFKIIRQKKFELSGASGLFLD